MATEGAAFGVELYFPWDAPEAVVDISSALEVYSRRHWTNRSSGGCCGMPYSTGSRFRSVRVLIPDPQGLDQSFHDVTIVDMGDVPESSVSIPDLSSLSQQWPPAVISHMGWLSSGT